MRRFAMMFLAAAGLVAAGRGAAYAVTFTDIVDFESGVSYQGVSCEKIKGDFRAPPFVYEHRLASLPGGVKWERATLSLTHSGNAWAWEHPEMWVLYGEQTRTHELKLLGALGQSDGCWKTDLFALDQGWLDAIAGGAVWDLYLYDPTSGLDDLYLDRSVFSGDYTPAGRAGAPVPEPGSLLLLASGLAGFAGMKLAARKRAG